MAISFAADIKPLFTAQDQDCMLNDVGMFNLWNYDDVKTHANEIYACVQDGTMPPPGSGERWTQSQIDKFKQWMDGGFQP